MYHIYIIMYGSHIDIILVKAIMCARTPMHTYMHRAAHIHIHTCARALSLSLFLSLSLSLSRSFLPSHALTHMHLYTFLSVHVFISGSSAAALLMEATKPYTLNPRIYTYCIASIHTALDA